MRKTRKILSLVLALALVVGMAAGLSTTAKAANYTVPITSYDAFKNATNGNSYDIDGYYGAQCWDGAALLWQQLGRSLITRPEGNGYAYMCWAVSKETNAGNDFDLIYDKTQIKRGDVIVFNYTSGNPAGHIAFADADYNGSNLLDCYGQNQRGDGSGYPFTVDKFNLNTFLGAFRYKGWSTHTHNYTAKYEWSVSNGSGSCTAKQVCDCGDVKSQQTVTASVSTTPATCTEAGKYVYTATFSNSAFSTQTKTETIPALGHDMEYKPYIAPKCEEEGQKEHYHCKRCGLNFSDAAGTQEFTEDTVIPELGHDWDYDWYVTQDAQEGVPGEETMHCRRDHSHTQTRPIYLVKVKYGDTDNIQAPAGRTVTITSWDAEDFLFLHWEVKSGNVKLADEKAKKTTFTMPDEEVSILGEYCYLKTTDKAAQDGSSETPEPTKPVSKANPSKKFSDVDQSAWYREYIDYVLENNLMNGVSADKFAPNATTTRAMIVTMLYRLAGEPTVSGTNPFKDVANGQWYTNAIIWAAENDIVTGYGDGKFGLNDEITREQFAAILYRYAKYKGYDVSKSADLSKYTDASTISSYALDAMKWAVGEGIITGRTATTLAPKGSATRAEAAAMFMRFIESVK